MSRYRHGFVMAALCVACARGERSSTAPPTPEPAVTPAASVPLVRRAPPKRAKNSLFGLVRPAEELSQPERVLSPDGRHAVSVREQPDLGLWISDADGSNAEVLVEMKGVTVDNPPEGTLLAKTSGLFHLEFSTDGKRVYFQADGWGTSLALYSVELATRRVRFIHDANGYQVIRSCSDAKQIGRLIILEHRYFDPIPTGAVDWFFLIDDRAKRYGIVGPEQENVNRFLASSCGVGQAPAAGEAAPVPARLQRNLACQGETLKRKRVHFLDGTNLDLFFVYDDSELAKNPKTLPMVLGLEDARRWEGAQCGSAGRRQCVIPDECDTASSG